MHAACMRGVDALHYAPSADMFIVKHLTILGFAFRGRRPKKSEK